MRLVIVIVTSSACVVTVRQTWINKIYNKNVHAHMIVSLIALKRTTNFNI